MHRRTITNKLLRGELPGVKTGKEWRIRKEDLDEYLKGSFKPQDKPSNETKAGPSVVEVLMAELEAKNPGKPLPFPEGYEALRDRVWQGLGYPDGYTWENYVDHVNKHGGDTYILRAQQEKLLTPEERAVLLEGMVVESVNPLRMALAASAAGKLTPLTNDKTKEELESAHPARSPRSRAD
jgi:excisionase family DNA binding protein